MCAIAHTPDTVAVAHNLAVVVEAGMPGTDSVAAAAANLDPALVGPMMAHIDMKREAEEAGKPKIVDTTVGVGIDI